VLGLFLEEVGTHRKKNHQPSAKLVTNFYEKKVLTVMVNNATNINKVNNHHSLNTQNDHKTFKD
jgi:hypothetical protein